MFFSPFYDHELFKMTRQIVLMAGLQLIPMETHTLTGLTLNLDPSILVRIQIKYV